MDIGSLWSGVLSLLVGLIMWNFRNASEELKRLQILVNRTREEMAKEYVTKEEVHSEINRVIDRLEKLDAKIDRLMEAKK